jgi:hypothetical protein
MKENKKMAALTMIKTDKDWSQPVFCSPVQLMAN